MSQKIKTSTLPYKHGTWCRDGKVLLGRCQGDPRRDNSLLPVGFEFVKGTLCAFREDEGSPWYRYSAEVIGWSEFLIDTHGAVHATLETVVMTAPVSGWYALPGTGQEIYLEAGQQLIRDGSTPKSGETRTKYR